jgi:hypothetical protein
MVESDRRRHQRIKLRTPIRGAVGVSRVFVTDGSVAGMAIAHQGALPPPGGICRVELASDWGPIRVDCEVVRTVEHVATPTRQPVYLSGLQIVVMDHQSAQRLRSLFDAVSHDNF